jgi:polar amino acid transport system permease protein
MASVGQFDIDLFIKILPDLAFGALVTIELTSLSILFGLIIGSVAGLARVSKNPLFRGISTVYVEIIRGTPLLVQILIIYFGLPAIGVNLQPVPAGIIALSICSGAYIAEIVRAGIESIPTGQMEAARSLGMSYLQAMRYVIFPQAFRNILPALGNEFIALLKDSSLLSVISIVELTRVGRQIVNTTFNAWTPFLGVALFYLMMTIPLSKLVDYSQKRLGTYEVK